MTWRLYDALIERIPGDVLVKEYCLGIGWSYVEADPLTWTIAAADARPAIEKVTD